MTNEQSQATPSGLTPPDFQQTILYLDALQAIIAMPDVAKALRHYANCEWCDVTLRDIGLLALNAVKGTQTKKCLSPQCEQTISIVRLNAEQVETLERTLDARLNCDDSEMYSTDDAVIEEILVALLRRTRGEGKARA